MGATLEALIALQDIELQIVDIRRQLGSKERGVRRQQSKVQQAQQALQSAHDEARQAQIMADNADLELKTKDESVNKLRDGLNSVRTNKEYAAILAQLNNEKAERTRIETRALELMSEVETRKQEETTLATTAQEEARRLENLTGQLDQARSSFSDRLTALEQQRDEAASKLDAKTIDLFNRLSERFDGEALARVIQPHPRRQEYLCEGCNMSVTIERANALMSRDEVVTCGSCGRILFIEPGK